LAQSFPSGVVLTREVLPDVVFLSDLLAVLEGGQEFPRGFFEFLALLTDIMHCPDGLFE
jgi:hypothetical protein